MNAAAKIQDRHVSDGRRDFDFLFGEWTVLHRRLKVRGAGSSDWDEFSGTTTCRGLMGALVNVDENDMPSRGFQGLTFRTFNIERREWAIYWVNSISGVLQPPVFGRFINGEGLFYGSDVDAGRPVLVVYVWEAITADSARWSQAFSYDDGRTWETNWIMAFTRAA
jgi:hypothetical protein